MLLSKATYTYSSTDDGGCPARCWPARQEQFGVQYLVQGHFDTQTSLRFWILTYEAALQ